MKNLLFTKSFFPEKLLRPTVEYILNTQLPDGCIPWFVGGKADPWDHVEAAMGLTVGGEYAAAKRAYLWLAREQLPDGSWWTEYNTQESVHKKNRETNFIAYIATGVWHYYSVTKDLQFLQHFFPSVKQAMDFVLQYQAPNGEIYWAVNEDGSPQEDALITACSSIYKSLECAIQAANLLNENNQKWQIAYKKLGDCLRYKPDRFDRTWEPKTRFSMDWFYPILAGVVNGKEARERIEAKWNQFVQEGVGCRCVSDEPWVTVAESSELTLALLAAGEHAKAVKVFSWLHQFMDNDGGYWTGYNFRDQVIWPHEKTTWTTGAILLAADALTEHTAAAQLFISNQILCEFPESSLHNH
jgi:hypothetical protein